MLNYTYPLLLVLLMWQCQEDTIYERSTVTESYTDGVKFGQSIVLEKGEPVTVYSNGGEAPRKLHVTLEQLFDSRCPANAACVTYGNAAVVLSASNSQGANKAIELCIGKCDTEPIRDTHTVTTLVGETSYRFTLKEVVPFPGLEKDGEKKVAKLVVEKM
ncbi:hypothetical protein ACFSKU_12695 [Pontibacter silvestris]|uniref:Lipoprotein n=1 Tax=Pontibacter silvestris TaxID=2305183 RepID=A0ABW4X012_9BACT|nr:hypothetical protein [Pontibacter silvestris]MCC9138434.1 hypothetical protein [Pontibacter silvestris]